MHKEKLEMERSSLIVFCFFMISNIGNYTFQILMGNIMTAEDYGILNALISLTNFSTVISGAWLATSAKYSANYAAENKLENIKEMLRHLAKQISVVALIIFVVGLVGADLFSKLLHIEDKLYIQDTMLLVAISCILPVFAGTLQGLKRFIPYSVQNLIIVLAKLLGGFAAVMVGWGIRGCIGALTLGTCIAIAYCLFSIRDVFKIRESTPTTQGQIRMTQYFYSAFWIQLFLAVLNNGDMLLIKIFAPTPELAGVYSSGLVISKIPCYISGAIVAVLFPLVAESQAKCKDAKILLKKAMCYGGGIAILGAATLNIGGRWIIDLLFGERYNGTVELLLPMSCLIVPVTFLTILINYLLPLGQTRFLTISLGICYALSAILIWFIHSDISQILYIVGAMLTITFFINVLTIFYGGKNARGESA